ncbi:MAG TPA: CoB--CoM heterodisulfide reductase iron-sulfur subunit A family protein [Anaerolineaceae bacterium]|nr:CoB--CoM heterodisulfide reductase iron-sulfur subunit A family protein [Anaerolineaceae bacterium]
MVDRALVIGAGIAGIQVSLDIANSGYEVVLIEKEPSIGGHMAQLSETFPTLDCSQCILTPRTVEVGHHENIHLYTYSQVESIQRESDSNDFLVRIRQKATYINWELCTGCGVCQEKCPFKTDSWFERSMGPRKVVYTLSPQAVPNKPVIDAPNCRYLQSKWDIEAGRLPATNAKGEPAKPKCGACVKFCPTGAIDFDQQDKFIEERVGAVVIAAGYDLFPMSKLPEYGGGRIPDVIDGLAFERLLAASGPTSGKVIRPSDGKIPKEVVFIQCSGSRDPERGVPYCSKICCMYTAKQAILYKHRVHDGQAYIFYIDVRAGGKGYEEFLNRAQEEESVVYLRGKVSKLFREDGKIIVKGVDTLSGRTVEIEADLVVLATAVIPKIESTALAESIGLDLDEQGYFISNDDELDPMTSKIPGIFLAGTALGPKDIPETVAQASGAAAKVLALFQGRKVKEKVGANE